LYKIVLMQYQILLAFTLWIKHYKMGVNTILNTGGIDTLVRKFILNCVYTVQLTCEIFKIFECWVNRMPCSHRILILNKQILQCYWELVGFTVLKENVQCCAKTLQSLLTS
jgi:hypothetical protein